MDLSTEYMGLQLKNPLVPSSSPLSHNIDSIRRLEDAGAAAIVMYSLFEEQITLESYYLDYYLDHGTESYSEARSYFPEMDDYNVGPDQYVDLIRRAKDAVDIPIIGSLNGSSPGGWTQYASLIEDAGADGLELNIYYIPTRTDQSGSDVEEKYIDVLRDVRKAVSIPIAMKLSPYFSSTANMALRLSEWGANAAVLFNRFYQPDFDLENLEVTPRLVLSSAHEMRLPLTWVAMLYGRVPMDFAITTGVHTHQDALKALMAGAKVAMMASELLRGGVKRIAQILDDMESWLVEREYASIKQLIGCMSRQHVAEPQAFERANYMKMLASYRPVN